MRQQLILNLWVKRIKFRLEFGVENYLPRHRNSMYSESYVVKYILLRLRVLLSRTYSSSDVRQPAGGWGLRDPITAAVPAPAGPWNSPPWMAGGRGGRSWRGAFFCFWRGAGRGRGVRV